MWEWSVYWTPSTWIALVGIYEHCDEPNSFISSNLIHNSYINSEKLNQCGHLVQQNMQDQATNTKLHKNKNQR